MESKNLFTYSNYLSSIFFYGDVGAFTISSTYLGHVHVIYEDNEAFAGWRSICVLGSFLYISLQVSLHIQRGRPAREVHVQ